MPIYEYACKACGHEFEVMQKISDKPIRKCEACGRLKAARQISQTTFLLKGTGWYTTDYAGKKAHGGAEGESSSAPAPDAKAEAKPEAKAEPAKPAKADAKPAAKKAASA